MLRPHGFSIIELLLITVIIGIIAAIAIPNYVAMQARAKEAATLEVAHVVQLAAEDHAVQNEGIYSDQAVDLAPNFPNGMMLRNSFTQDRTEPQFGVTATTPGQVGIVCQVNAGVRDGYTITAFGRTELLITFTNGL